MVEEEEELPNPEPKRFTNRELEVFFALILEELAKLKAQDPNTSRYTKVTRVITDSLQCYYKNIRRRRGHPSRLTSTNFTSGASIDSLPKSPQHLPLQLSPAFRPVCVSLSCSAHSSVQASLTSKGHFAKADVAGHAVGDKGQIISPKYERKGRSYKCAKFYYILTGLTETAQLEVFVQPEEPSSRLSLPALPIFIQREGQGDGWNHGEGVLPDLEAFKLIFQVKVLRNDSHTLIGVDDVYSTRESCLYTQGCDFEHDLCKWNNDQNDDIDWLLQSPSDGSIAEGPVRDHSLGTTEGHYLLISASLLSSEWGVAHLSSPRYPPTNTGSCVSFWYNAAFTYGSLTVALDTGYGWHTLWEVPQGFDTHWHYGEVSAIQKDHSFKVIIIGKLKRGTDSAWIALDDVSYNHGETCSGGLKPHNADVVEMISNTTSQTTALQEVSCNFNDKCQYTGSEELVIGTTNDVHDYTDHGKYLYLPSSHVQDTTVYSVESLRNAPEGSPSNMYCLSFWYYMFGTVCPWLSVVRNDILNEAGNDTKSNYIWQRTTGMVDTWKYSRIDINTRAGDWKISDWLASHGDNAIAFQDLKTEITILGPCPRRCL
ncbi:hypothetical protein SK128_025181 [Halocaridina rubra]|uniref:MAM domain-containing protein n=1 Tax=Halocaridina rubra TaxID=373956 RepID=A0AAN9A4F1_HALRR